MTASSAAPARRPQRVRRLAIAAGLGLATIAAACSPTPGVPGESSTTTSTTVAPSDPNAVDGAQLSWAYSQYAQYGVFGQWSQTPVGHNVQVNLADGQAVTGLESEAGVTYLQGQFDDGTGSIDPVTGEGTITWDSGDWVLNAYNGLFGAPDETLRDPILDIDADGSGTLSFEAFIPKALDIDGNPAGTSGPDRITVATFSDVTLTEHGLTATPDFAGRTYVPSESAYGEDGTVSCIVDGVETGGSWPAEWIDFLPPSVKAHYFTTGCSGLNLRKPPAPFTVTWGDEAPAITRQPTLNQSTLYASALPRNFGARVGVAGVPTPSVQWQRSFDGIEWAAIDGATSTVLSHPLGAADDGASFRALVAGVPTEAIGPVAVLTRPTAIVAVPDQVVVGRGTPLTLNVNISGSPLPEVSWERSDDGGTTWVPVVADGVTTVNTDMTAPGTATAPGTYIAGLRYLSATDAENGAKFRVRASNGLGDPAEVVSSAITAAVRFDAPSFTGHPLSTAAFEGQGISINAYTTGLPAPKNQWQTSTDGGSTWTDVDSISTTNYSIAAEDVSLDKDGLKVRMVATSAAGTTISNVATVRVFERTSGRQLIVVPSESVDPTVRNDFTVIGAGWEPSTVGNMRVGITNSGVWQPGQPGIAAGAAHGSANVSRAALTSNGGFFRTTYSIAENVFSNPSVTYGVGTYGVNAADQHYDSWTPIAIAWPTPAGGQG